MLRPLLVRASESEALARWVSGWSPTRRQALRFVAGETLDEGLAASRRLAARGRLLTLDAVGERVEAEEQARAAAKDYLEALDRMRQERLPAGVSVKPTQLGLAVAVGLCEELLDEIAAAAAEAGAHVTLDMEDRHVTEATIRLVERMHGRGHRHVGCALQAYLRRTPVDVRRLSALGASIRLCKGAYAEPSSAAFQTVQAVRQRYGQLAVWLLRHGTYPRIATHDHRLVSAVRDAAQRLDRSPAAFEFQMLYGVRPDLQQDLVRDGYRLCVYVPFGRQWYAYFMRRLAERPANLLFFLRALRGP